MLSLNINQHNFKVTFSLRYKYARNSQSHRTPKIQQGEPAEEVSAAHALLQTPPSPQRGICFFIEAASQTGINYLTAKTIVFFHKKDHKSYQFDLRLPSHRTPFRKKLTATYIYLKRKGLHEEKAAVPLTRVEVICSTGNVPISDDSRDLERESHASNDM